MKHTDVRTGATLLWVPYRGTPPRRVTVLDSRAWTSNHSEDYPITSALEDGSTRSLRARVITEADRGKTYLTRGPLVLDPEKHHGTEEVVVPVRLLHEATEEALERLESEAAEYAAKEAAERAATRRGEDAIRLLREHHPALEAGWSGGGPNALRVRADALVETLGLDADRTEERRAALLAVVETHLPYSEDESHGPRGHYVAEWHPEDRAIRNDPDLSGTDSRRAIHAARARRLVESLLALDTPTPTTPNKGATP